MINSLVPHINDVFSRIDIYPRRRYQNVSVNVDHDKGTMNVKFLLPGFSVEEITLELVEGTLHLTAERQVEKDNSVISSKITETVPLSYLVKEEEITAVLTQGILTVTLPPVPITKTPITITTPKEESKEEGT